MEFISGFVIGSVLVLYFYNQEKIAEWYAVVKGWFV